MGWCSTTVIFDRRAVRQPLATGRRAGCIGCCVTFTLRVDEALKTEFAAAAKACDLTGAQLLRAYVQQQAQATASADEVESTAIHSTIGAHIAKNQ